MSEKYNNASSILGNKIGWLLEFLYYILYDESSIIDLLIDFKLNGDKRTNNTECISNNNRKKRHKKWKILKHYKNLKRELQEVCWDKLFKFLEENILPSEPFSIKIIKWYPLKFNGRYCIVPTTRYGSLKEICLAILERNNMRSLINSKEKLIEKHDNSIKPELLLNYEDYLDNFGYQYNLSFEIYNGIKSMYKEYRKKAMIYVIKEKWKKLKALELKFETDDR